MSTYMSKPYQHHFPSVQLNDGTTKLLSDSGKATPHPPRPNPTTKRNLLHGTFHGHLPIAKGSFTLHYVGDSFTTITLRHRQALSANFLRRHPKRFTPSGNFIPRQCRVL